METVFGFFVALIFFYVLLEWRLNRVRRESEKRYVDLEAKLRWLYERLQELQARPATNAPSEEVVEKTAELRKAEEIAVPQGLTFSSGITPTPRALASSETPGRFADRVLLSSEPYRFTEKHLAEAEARFGVPAQLVDGEMVSWYGSRAAAGLRYLAQLRQSG